MDTQPTFLGISRRRALVAGGLVLATALAGAATRRQATPPPGPTPVPRHLAAAGGGPVTLSATLDRTAVRVGGDGLVRMELVLGGGHPSTGAAPRVATDLLVVLDRSGSMDGDKIEQARAAIRELVERLEPEDRFGLVTYANWAQLLLPIARADADNRRQWLATIAEVRPEGGTNISAGLDLALDAMSRSHEAGRSARVMLISDGLANQGDPSHEGLVARAKRAARSEVPLTTVGVGTDFNEYLMTALADAGTGSYYYVQRSTDLGDVFAREFGAARTTVASAVAVEIDPADGVEVLDAAGYPLERSGRRTAFQPGTLFAGQERRIWVTLRVPNDAPVERALGTFAVSYRTAAGSGRVSLDDVPRIACVVDDDAFFAAVAVPTWERSIAVESYNTMQEEVARQVKANAPAAAREALRKFRDETGRLNARLKSEVVKQKLDELKGLEDRVDDAFRGANQAEKQNALSKSGSAAAYDARRAGGKY